MAERRTRLRRRERGRANASGRSADDRWEQAVARVGHTPESRARWLVGFAARDSALVPETEREAIRWRLAAYLEGGRGEDPEAFHGRSAPAEEGEARQCREWLRAGLAELAQGKTWIIQLEFRPKYFISLKPPNVYRRAPMIDALVPFREVVLRDSVPVLLKRLRFCARNGCGEAFLSRKRQLYCSRQCGQSGSTTR